MWADNRKLLLHDVEAPPGSTITVRWENSSTSAYSETTVTSVSTIFDLTLTVAGGTVDEPEAYLRALDDVVLQLRRLGFQYVDISGHGFGGDDRKLRKDGVEVLLTFAIPSNTSIVVQRDW